ncbi:hypothetical protein KXJ72_15315 [Comamonas aquatica]|nr:hypothetical protein KXJ72_15315 [Comamonas aquatica]
MVLYLKPWFYLRGQLLLLAFGRTHAPRKKAALRLPFLRRTLRLLALFALLTISAAS